MQTPEQIKQCILATKKDLDLKYKHISLRTYPFEDDIVDVLPCIGLYYSEDYWTDNLFFITRKGYYFTKSDILDSHWESDDEQPYAEFLIGITKIANIIKFNEDISPLLNLIRTIVTHGKISASKYNRGPFTGMTHYKYCHEWYTWIGTEYKNN